MSKPSRRKRPEIRAKAKPLPLTPSPAPEPRNMALAIGIRRALLSGSLSEERKKVSKPAKIDFFAKAGSK